MSQGAEGPGSCTRPGGTPLRGRGCPRAFSFHTSPGPAGPSRETALALREPEHLQPVAMPVSLYRAEGVEAGAC